MNKGGRPRKEPAPDQMISGPQLREALGVSQRTLAGMIQAGTVPPPDFTYNRQCLRWRRATLAKAGIDIPIEVAK